MSQAYRSTSPWSTLAGPFPLPTSRRWQGHSTNRFRPQLDTRDAGVLAHRRPHRAAADRGRRLHQLRRSGRRARRASVRPGRPGERPDWGVQDLGRACRVSAQTSWRPSSAPTHDTGASETHRFDVPTTPLATALVTYASWVAADPPTRAVWDGPTLGGRLARSCSSGRRYDLLATRSDAAELLRLLHCGHELHATPTRGAGGPRLRRVREVHHTQRPLLRCLLGAYSQPISYVPSTLRIRD